MVSKASEDLPEPDRPVITTSLWRGISTSTFLRLCTRAPRTEIHSWAIGNLDRSTAGTPSELDARRVSALEYRSVRYAWLMTSDAAAFHDFEQQGWERA